MNSLESEIRQLLDGKGLSYVDNTSSKDGLDFSFYVRAYDVFFHLEVKEKRQAYRLDHWPATDIPERYLFIQDDLSSRKILRHGPNSGLLVRNNPWNSYHFFDVATLFLMPRKRVNRPVFNEDTYKGKWMIDLRNGRTSASLMGSFRQLRAYLRQRAKIYHEMSNCYGDFFGEEIEIAGQVRSEEQLDFDLQVTR